MGSIKTRLLAWSLTIVALVWLGTALFTYFDARHEIDELLDAHLAQAAALLVAQATHELDEVEAEHVDVPHKYSRQVAFQIWQDGRLCLHSREAPDEPLGSNQVGFSERVVGGNRWRTYTARDPSGEFLIQVGERTDAREELAREIGLHMLQPLLYSLPLLALLLWTAVRRGLRPLQRITKDIARREPNDLAPLDPQRTPSEIKPLIDQLNRLFARIVASIDNERRFTANAAHELRTPIAGLKAQAQVARGASEDAERVRALDNVVLGCDRATRLIEQLLTLARLEHVDASAAEPCSLRTVATNAIRDIASFAYEAHVAVELADGADVEARGNQELLQVMLRNLLDNAIRYSPAGTSVRVCIARERSRATLRVSDQGPGIPAEERDKALQPFYRILGSGQSGTGLGLSIVVRIAELHHAGVQLTAGENNRGLAVTVTFPEIQRAV